MATVTITGTFKNSGNNGVSIDVHRSNPDKYWFGKHYDQSFTKVLDDLVSDRVYSVTYEGHTTGTFEIEVKGDVVAIKSASHGPGPFSDNGFTFRTK